MEVIVDDLTSGEIALFLEEHIEEMKSISSPESKHALDLEGLKKPEITFWSVYGNGKLVGCGALKELDGEHGEIKSMRTVLSERGSGIASNLLAHIIEVAKLRGYRKLSLETGAMAFFEPARRLYAKHGFRSCRPFADYKEDPNSVFMSLTI